MNSLIVLSGVVSSIHHHEQAIRFNLRVEEGVFSIHLPGRLAAALDGRLHRSAAVCVIGRPRSYYHRRRGANLIYVEALVCFFPALADSA